LSSARSLHGRRHPRFRIAPFELRILLQEFIWDGIFFWKESRIMDQRLQFLSSYQKEETSVAELCRAYGISRPTAYRWINRYNATGPEGLVDRSRRPHSCSHATPEPIENAILALRAKHPSWGARKLKARLEMLQPDVVWPAASTFGNILSRAGCFRKSYFPHTRFSNDLEFSSTSAIQEDQLIAELNAICGFEQKEAGVVFEKDRNWVGKKSSLFACIGTVHLAPYAFA
jgi:transposase